MTLISRAVVFAILLGWGAHATAVDTDGDGLLDLIDVPGFDPAQTGIGSFDRQQIQDLDGAALLKNLETLSLRINDITSLEAGDFQGLGNLQTLDLFRNEVTSIESGAFQGLSNLQTLDLSFNGRPGERTRIESGAFQGLDNLKTLHLSGSTRFNAVTKIENGTFQGLGNLETLHFSINGVTSIEIGAFDGLDNLKNLHLEGNQITGLDRVAFEELDNLETLHLERNQIASLGRGDFDGLDNLKTLHLEHNQITGLDRGSFEGLDNLQELNLASNEIENIEVGAFNGLDNLLELSLWRNSINTPLKSDTFQGLRNLERLNLRYNWNRFNSEFHIESGAFNGLDNLQFIDLHSNSKPLTLESGVFKNFGRVQSLSLNISRDAPVADLSRADFSSLQFLYAHHSTLNLDDAQLSGMSILGRHPAESVSFVGVRFSSEQPESLGLSDRTAFSRSLDHLTIDQHLYESHTDDLDRWRLERGKKLVVIGYGDANKDGLFNSNDLVQVFQAGEYEDGIAENSYWTTGDWNSDGDFSSRDLVAAFRAGQYEWTGQFGWDAVPTVVPEPSAMVLLLFGLIALRRSTRRDR